MKKILNWNNQFDINIISRSLKNGEVILGTSDTVLGLLADLSPEGFKKLNFIKKREKNPYLFLIESANKISFFSDIKIHQKLKNLIDNCWPGPVTLIFQAKKNMPQYLQSEEEKVALRVPKHEGLLFLLRNFMGLFSTSANISGEPIPTYIKNVDPKILNNIANIITDTGKDEKYTETPSTILDCSKSKIKIIREGIYPIKKLESLYGQKFEK